MGLKKTQIFIIAALSVIAVSAQRCPIGQFRDPVTGQCTGPAVGPSGGRCPIGQFRDPTTGDCRGPNVFGQPTGGQYVPDDQLCPPGTVFNQLMGRCATYQDWFCNLCSECCAGSSYRYQQIYQCYYDVQGNFEGCLSKYGFSRPTITNLVSVRTHPVFLPALFTFLG